MWNNILDKLTIIILVLAGLLILSSMLGYVVDIGNVLQIKFVHFYTGLFLIGLSIILAITLLLQHSHPLYEYWIIIMIGSTVGAIYIG